MGVHHSLPCVCDNTRSGNNLLTYSMEQSRSWEANRFSASQEILHILWNPKVHYPILSQFDPVHTPTSQFLKIHPPIKAWVSHSVSFPQVSPPKPCIRLSSPPNALHAPPILLYTRHILYFNIHCELVTSFGLYNSNFCNENNSGIWSSNIQMGWVLILSLYVFLICFIMVIHKSRNM